MHRDLDRFLDAQAMQTDGYRDALDQLRQGRKTGEWMWYIFPQIQGLGKTYEAQRYAIVSLDEARAYFAHPILGPRLLECARALLATKRRSGRSLSGSVPASPTIARTSCSAISRGAPGLMRRADSRKQAGMADPSNTRVVGSMLSSARARRVTG